MLDRFGYDDSEQAPSVTFPQYDYPEQEEGGDDGMMVTEELPSTSELQPLQ